MEITSREKKVSIGILILATVAAGLYGYLTPVNNYEKFSIESFDSEVRQVTAECTCYGSLMVAESYPPQYNCQGYEMCKSVNYTRKGK